MLWQLKFYWCKRFFICVASSRISALLLYSRRTIHPIFKILINYNKDSFYSINKNFNHVEFICQVLLIIWNKRLMQYCHYLRKIDYSFINIWNIDCPFERAIIVFSKDFCQILLVIMKRTQEEITAIYFDI